MDMRAAAPDLETSLRRAEHLLRISVTLNSTRDAEQLLTYIIESAADLLHCEATSILLYDEERHVLRFAAATGANPQQLAQIPVPLEGSLAGVIFSRNEHLIINDVARDGRHFGLVGKKVKLQTRNLIGVPMGISGQPTGVLEALNKREGAFDDTDVETLSIIASQAAIAIRNMRQVTALEEAYERLQQLDRLKSDFMALASHELRTPLSVILGYGDILREEAGTDLQEFVEAVLHAGGQMADVIETMTHMTLLRSGPATFPKQPVLLQELIRSALDAVREPAERKGHHLRLDLPDAPCAVPADPKRLHLVLVNLLKNAVQFTPESGTVTVRLTHGREEARIEVIDTGIGLAADEQERIFDEFYQVQDHLTREHGGLGLGLTIAREIVLAHGGRLAAESAGPGRGTTLHLWLPQAPAPAS